MRYKRLTIHAVSDTIYTVARYRHGEAPEIEARSLIAPPRVDRFYPAAIHIRIDSPGSKGGTGEGKHLFSGIALHLPRISVIESRAAGRGA